MSQRVGWAKARLRRAHHRSGHDAMGYELMVGTPPDAFASGGFAHPLRTGVPKVQTDCYPRPADLTARWQIDGIFSAKSWRPRFSRNCSPPRIRREKTSRLPHEKLRAFSLPQDLQVELMFGAARFGELVLSASRGLGFHVAPRRRHSPQRLGTPHKCFNQQRIFAATGRFAAPCGLNACSGAVFRKHRRA